jgi:hypothetical protein
MSVKYTVTKYVAVVWPGLVAVPPASQPPGVDWHFVPSMLTSLRSLGTSGIVLGRECDPPDEDDGPVESSALGEELQPESAKTEMVVDAKMAKLLVALNFIPLNLFLSVLSL